MNPITVTATCIVLEHKLDGESTITLRFNAPDNNEAVQITNLGDFVFKTTSQETANSFTIGGTYTITLQ